MLVPFLYNFKFKVSEIKIYLIKIGFISFFLYKFCLNLKIRAIKNFFIIIIFLYLHLNKKFLYLFLFNLIK